MLLENIPLGKTVEIFVDRSDFRFRLVSKVEDVNAFRVCVTAITTRGVFFQFRPDDRIRLVYRDDTVMWEWDHVRAGLAKLHDNPVHYLQVRDKGQSFNRRGAYRLKILEYATVQYYEIPGKVNTVSELPEISVEDMDHMSQQQKDIVLEMNSPKEEKCMIKDISESGVGIYTDKEFQVDDEFFLDISTPYGLLSVRAKIVRKEDVSEQEITFAYLFGCELTQADQKLIRYIYDLQRKLLKRKKFTSAEKTIWEKERIEKEKNRQVLLKKQQEYKEKEKKEGKVFGIKRGDGIITKEQWDQA